MTNVTTCLAKIGKLALVGCLLAFPAAGFSESGGGDGAGGGNPEELLEASLSINHENAVRYRAWLHKKAKRADQPPISQETAKHGLTNWAGLTVDLYRVLSAAKLVGLDQVISSDELEAAFHSVFTAANENSFKISSEFSMPDDNGKLKRALFRSSEGSQSITLNGPYLQELLQVNAFRLPTSGEYFSGAKAPKKSEAAKVARYIYEMYQLTAGLVGILFHEALVLKGIEQSRSYPFSKKFTVEVFSLLTGRERTLEMIKTLGIANNQKIAESLSRITGIGYPTGGANTLANYDKLISITNLNPETFFQAKAFILSRTSLASLESVTNRIDCETRNRSVLNEFAEELKVLDERIGELEQKRNEFDEQLVILWTRRIESSKSDIRDKQRTFMLFSSCTD